MRRLITQRLRGSRMTTIVWRGAHAWHKETPLCGADAALSGDEPVGSICALCFIAAPEVPPWWKAAAGREIAASQLTMDFDEATEMNKQGKLINSRVVGGIEWTKTILADSTEQQGYTWNVIGGCLHQCRWQMPDGSTAICYAEEVAERLATAAYPHGFAHHYWHPDRLREPFTVKAPSRIFLDSMADLFGRWVPTEQIQAVLDTVCEAEHHTFQALTKNAPRLLGIKDFPPNLWLGVSSPPDQMLGQALTQAQQQKMLRRSLDVLSQFPSRVTWMSFEPLSWDVSAIVADYPGALDWAVIGAASNGAKTYQPDPGHVQALIDVLDQQGVKVFFKGNLKGNAAANPWREEFPEGVL
jgi:protein gp37